MENVLSWFPIYRKVAFYSNKPKDKNHRLIIVLPLARNERGQHHAICYLAFGLKLVVYEQFCSRVI